MRSSGFAIAGVVLGWSLVMMSPAFADTSSSSSFILTDSFSIVGSPSDVSASFTQKGAGGFGANPVPPSTSVTTSTNTRSRSSTSSLPSQYTPPPTEILDSDSQETSPQPSSTVLTPPSEVEPTPAAEDSSVVLTPSPTPSVIDRVIDTLDAARQTIIAPFKRASTPAPTVADIQPTIVAVTPSSQHTSSTSTTVETNQSESSIPVSPTATESNVKPSITISEQIKQKGISTGLFVSKVTASSRLGIRTGAQRISSAVRRATTAVASSMVAAARATVSWFQKIWGSMFASAKKVEAAIKSAWVPARTMASVKEHVRQIPSIVVRIPAPEQVNPLSLRKHVSKEWNQINAQLGELLTTTNKAVTNRVNEISVFYQNQ